LKNIWYSVYSVYLFLEFLIGKDLTVASTWLNAHFLQDIYLLRWKWWDELQPAITQREKWCL